jgi:hypothetical protein
VTVSGEGQPHIGLYPFLLTGNAIEMHLHRNDEQLADLAGQSALQLRGGRSAGHHPVALDP